MQTEEKKERERGERKLAAREENLRYFQSFALHMTVILFIIWILMLKVIGFVTVRNADMYPRIDAGDLVMFYRLDKDPSAQDVIVFKKNDTVYVGRVMAREGDTVEITNSGSVKVNGNSLSESGIYYETFPYEGYTEYPLTLEGGSCFVMMDMRNGGEDSRYFGPVTKNEIMGTAVMLVRRNNM